MAYEHILTEIHDRVGLIRINRPKALNALSPELLGELMDAAAALDADDQIGALVITGSDRAFAAGADIKQMATATTAEMLNLTFINLWDRLRAVHKPVIAAVSGYCLGGGNELAMTCDLIVASESAVFGQPEINLGVIPGAGGTQRLARAIGKALTMEMVLNDRRLTAAEALQYGLVNHVYPLETYLEESIKLAASIAARAPIAVRIGKESVNTAFETGLTAGLEHERRLFYLLFGTEDQKEGMAAFVDKRPAQWKGR
jgi:enoyl-CoA hydratase